MLRTIDINIPVVSGQGTYLFPSNSLGLLPTDIIKGIAVRATGVNKEGKTLINSDVLNQSFVTIKENGGKNIHASLSLGKVLEMSNSDRFQMLPISTKKGIHWEESKIIMLSGEVTGRVIEFTIYFVSAEDAANC